MHKDHTNCPQCGAQAVVVADQKNVAWECGAHVHEKSANVVVYRWVCLEVTRLQRMIEEAA